MVPLTSTIKLGRAGGGRQAFGHIADHRLSRAVASGECRVGRKRKAVASENEEPDRNDPTFVPCI